MKRCERLNKNYEYKIKINNFLYNNCVKTKYKTAYHPKQLMVVYNT